MSILDFHHVMQKGPRQTILVGGFNYLEKYEFVNRKDYPIYYGK